MTHNHLLSDSITMWGSFPKCDNKKPMEINSWFARNTVCLRYIFLLFVLGKCVPSIGLWNLENHVFLFPCSCAADTVGLYN